MFLLKTVINYHSNKLSRIFQACSGIILQKEYFKRMLHFCMSTLLVKEHRQIRNQQHIDKDPLGEKDQEVLS